MLIHVLGNVIRLHIILICLIKGTMGLRFAVLLAETLKQGNHRC